MNNSKTTPNEPLTYDQMLSHEGLYTITGNYPDIRVRVIKTSLGMRMALYMEESGIVDELIEELWYNDRFIKCDDMVTIMFNKRMDNP